jgi:ribosomal protein S27AE
MKTCTKCLQAKREYEFYGTAASCKECTKKRVSAHRAANHDRVCAYDRARSQRPERKLKSAAYQRGMKERSPEKKRARTAVSNAVRDGRLKRQPCVHCGSLRVQAHHHDYSKPLDVEWVCFKCHREHEHGQRVEDPGRTREGAVDAIQKEVAA